MGWLFIFLINGLCNECIVRFSRDIECLFARATGWSAVFEARGIELEDFCQALHLSPEMKYESEGGPSLEDSFALLGQRIASGCMAGRNKVTLFQGVVFNFLIGNGDASRKDFFYFI